MKKIFLTVLFIGASILSSKAQFAQEDVFPGIKGQELYNKVVSNFKASTVLNYSNARDTMYLRVYRLQDSVECIYSGHKRHLPLNVDPSTHLYSSGDPDGINTEHSYPQSKGAKDGNARSDMHHLFPARVSVNEERSSLPFAEIPDYKTLKWFYKTIESKNIPGNSTIDFYSEKWTETWEPRESVKGDIARAIFYFYTMYKESADAADSDFFNIQKETLCDWHYLDPVDSLEWHRNILKAQWQDGKRNPFILDCSLVGRMYCDNVPSACAIIPIQEETNPIKIELIQNPATDYLRFSHTQDLNMVHRYRIITTSGQIIKESKITDGKIPIHNLKEGIYYLKFTNKKGLPILPIKFVKTN